MESKSAEVIEEYNPWWVSKERINEVEVYRKYEESEVRWVSDVIEKVSLSPYSLNFIFGPRQVGGVHRVNITNKEATGGRESKP